MKRLTKEQEASLDEVIETFKRESFTKKAEQTRNEIREALKQLILHICWMKQITKMNLAESIEYFICLYADLYAKDDKELLQEALDFFNKDCQQGQRQIACNDFRAAVIDTNKGKQLAILNEQFELL